MDVQTALLRIAQGAVANVAQHAGATTVDIVLTLSPTEATLVVHDDGVGFDRDRVGLDTATSDSFGLRAMAERVEQLGGGLTVDSAPGRGTTVTVVVDRGAA